MNLRSPKSSAESARNIISTVAPPAIIGKRLQNVQWLSKTLPKPFSKNSKNVPKRLFEGFGEIINGKPDFPTWPTRNHMFCPSKPKPKPTFHGFKFKVRVARDIGQLLLSSLQQFTVLSSQFAVHTSQTVRTQ